MIQMQLLRPLLPMSTAEAPTASNPETIYDQDAVQKTLYLGYTAGIINRNMEINMGNIGGLIWETFLLGINMGNIFREILFKFVLLVCGGLRRKILVENDILKK